MEEGVQAEGEVEGFFWGVWDVEEEQSEEVCLGEWSMGGQSGCECE